MIEDDEQVATLLAQAFATQGHRTTVAPSGEEGLRCLDQERPDVVFLDVRLPAMSGVEVLRAIRSLGDELPVVLVTGNATLSELGEAQRLGVLDIVEKPDILNNLTAALAQIASKPQIR